MKKLFTTIFLFSVSLFSLGQATFCHVNGNVIIYSNYDGGYLNINVDQNIPNLKIGITTYEKCEVTFSGAYVNNITQVIYAGYNANNNHCTPSPATTVINGAPTGTDSIVLIPNSTWSNTNGYGFIICNYSCDSATNQGGCNTPDQLVHYYITHFGGSLYYHFTQYGCWSGTYNVSDGGNCCIGANLLQPTGNIQAGFTMSNDTICSKDTLPYTNASTNTFPGGTHYNWNFGDGTAADTSANPTHAYNSAGTFTITLIATNSGNTAADTFTMQVGVINCQGLGIKELKDESLQLKVAPNPASKDISISWNGLLPDGELTITGMDGRVIYRKKLTEEEGTINLDVTGWQLAVYNVNICDKSNCKNQKLVIIN